MIGLAKPRLAESEKLPKLFHIHNNWYYGPAVVMDFNVIHIVSDPIHMLSLIVRAASNHRVLNVPMEL